MHIIFIENGKEQFSRHLFGRFIPLFTKFVGLHPDELHSRQCKSISQAVLTGLILSCTQKSKYEIREYLWQLFQATTQHPEAKIKVNIYHKE